MKKIIIFYILLSNLFSFGQKKIDVSISLVTDKSTKSSSKGDKMLEYNNYQLFEIISKITDIPLQYFHIENNSINQINVPINFKAISKEIINKDKLVSAFILEVENKFDVNINILNELRKVKVIYCFDKSKMNVCSNDINESKIIKINRTFKANCIKTDVFVKQIEDWYGIKIINELDSNYKYNIEMHHANSLEELNEELYYYYNIDIMDDNRLTKSIKIMKK